MSFHHKAASQHGRNKPDVETRRDMVFVFGSNKAGIHGSGAARYAHLKHGAIMGQGVGHHGNSYAVPTKGQPGSVDKQRGIGSTLSLMEIFSYVEEFIKYARQHPELKFQITRLGCGLAGLQDAWVAPMFVKAPENCYFDTVWREFLPERSGDDYRYWGTF